MTSGRQPDAQGRAQQAGTRLRALAVAVAVSLLLVLPLMRSSLGGTGSAWTTYHGDPSRTGFDPGEPVVSSSPPLDWVSGVLDGQIYAEPLVVDGRVFIATESNTIYALDETTGGLAPGWTAPTNIGAPVPASSLGADCSNIDPVGITGTPVIDTASGLLYAVALLRSPAIHYVMVAIDITNGSIRFQRPIDPPGLDSIQQLQRPALALSGGRIYIGFGSRGDCLPYNGWVVGASASDASDPLDYYVVGNSGVPAPGGAIWAPSGIAIDAGGFLYVASGNAGTGEFDHGDSVIRLATGPLREDSYFAPTDWSYLASIDADLGSVAPTLLNDGLIFQVGKAQVGYLLRANALGGIGGELFQAPVCGNGAYGGTAYVPPYVFVSCQTTGIQRISVDPVGLQFHVDWFSGGSDSLPAIGPPVVAGGLVWAVDNAASELRAYSFADGSDAFAPISLGAFGTPTHFSSLAAANGRLFVPAGTRVAAFRLTGTPPPTPTPPTPTPPTPPPGAALLGDNAIEPTADGSGVGVAEANQFTATATGQATSLSIYVDPSNRATRFSLGLYADAAGVPGTLLAQGTTTSVQNGTWNSVAITATTLTAGTPYWIARLALAGGEVITRVDNGAPNPDRVDSRTNASLPGTFSAAGSWPHRTSMYAAAASGPTPTPPTPTPPTPTPPTPTPTPPTPTPPTPTPPTPTPPSGATTVTFDDLGSPDRSLSGQYAGINWGTGAWYLSSPWGRFTTNSISYPDGTPVSASFGFVTPATLQGVDAYNGGGTSSTITLSCAGNQTVTQSVAGGQLLTIATGWSTACTTVTIGSTNGWNTNFDNLVYR
jgi:hypothetical protein